MLDDLMLVKKRDPADTLGGVLRLGEQAEFAAEVLGENNVDSEITSVVLAGMGGSSLVADMVKVLTNGWLHLPLVVVKGYDLPGFADERTLVIALSHSGNTEETISCYDQAKEKGCRLAAMATGGKLLEKAAADNVRRVQVPAGAQPRMSTIYHLRAVLKLLESFGVIDGHLYDDLGGQSQWLSDQIKKWAPGVPESDNLAKQLAKKIIGKSPVFFAGELTWPLAYKWKISWNETAKNVAFWNQYPEFNHNEFIGWSQFPVEKPFSVIDLMSDLERPRIRQRIELSDRLLSGKRPAAQPVELAGETLLQQLIWGLALGDMVSIYGAILNNVNPEPVELIEKFKKELG